MINELLYHYFFILQNIRVFPTSYEKFTIKEITFYTIKTFTDTQ